MEQIIVIKEFILLFQYQILDLTKLTLLYKTLKAAKLIMTDKVILNHTNTKLLVVNIYKK